MKKTTCKITMASLILASTSIAYAKPVKVQVTIENVSPNFSTFLTPVWVGFHDGQAFDTYNGNTAASDRPILGSNAIEQLCEDGASEQISKDFELLQPFGVQATIAGLSGVTGPLDPGEIVSQEFVLDSDGPNRFFSYASMIIPSNDFCISNGSPQAHVIFDEDGNFQGQSFFVRGTEALDAGTEVNDELPENTAFFGQSTPNTGIDQNGFIGTLGSDLPATGFLPADDRKGVPNILGTDRFAEANFLIPGFSFLKVTFTQSPVITNQ